MEEYKVTYVNTGWVPNPKGNILRDIKDMIWDDIKKVWIVKENEDKDDSK